MRMTLCAVALALAIAGQLPGMPAQASDYGIAQAQSTSINIGRIKAALRLTREQARF